MENSQEILFKLSMFEQQIQQIQQQLEIVEQSLFDITSINLGLDDISGAKGKEIFAPIGRGIFVKSKLLSEDLIVDIGGKNFVKKTVPETKNLIEKQIKKLQKVKSDLESSLEDMSSKINDTIKEAQSKERKN